MEFVSKKKVDLTPTQQMNTRTGAIKVSTPEATALDLVGYVHHCGGLNNVATVLSELSESIDAVRLVGAAKLVPITWAQRVGYLIDAAGAKEKTSDLAAYVNSKSPVRASLSPGQAVKGAEMNKRWKLFLNTSVEADF
jgi:predicted transcriptional regulator of viral defense system